MADFSVEIPETEKTSSKPIGLHMPKIIPELQFPLKLERCAVRLWYGSEFRGIYCTEKYQMWLLAPNIIKIESGNQLWVVYNATIVVDYYNYPTKDE